MKYNLVFQLFKFCDFLGRITSPAFKKSDRYRYVVSLQKRLKHSLTLAVPYPLSGTPAAAVAFLITYHLSLRSRYAGGQAERLNPRVPRSA
jgi:hypothetical protein